MPKYRRCTTITFLTDLQGNEHAITAVKTVHSEVNGDEDIKLKIYKQRNSKLDLKSISEMWTVTQDDIEYKITYIKQITNGNGFHLDVRGIPLFYDKFRSSIIHYQYNGSLTAVAYFTRVFDGTGYNFVLVNPSYAEQWEGFGKGQTRMELFKKGLDRYGYEFYIQGKTIYLKHQIGNDTNFEYRYKLNASNVSKAVDASALITHIKGFGNFEEGEEDYLNNAKLKREATSPLADILGIREPKVVVDGRISRTDTMDARLQKEIDESLYITVEATLHDIRQMGYEIAVPLKGDRSFLVDERLGFDAEIRVQSVTTTKDERNRVTQCDVVFGSANAGKRFKANLSAMARAISDLLDGKIELPYDILAPRAKEMLAKLMSVDTELVLDNGIFAVDPNNPNNIVGLNSAGWFISTDGGATAQTIATADGIVANSITSGELLTHLVRIVGTDGFMWMDGNEFVAMNPLDDKQFVRISPQTGLTVSKGSLNILSGNGENAVTVWDSAEGNAKLHADTVAGTAESNAKGHADTVAGTAEQNAKDHADGVDDNLRNDLQMTSPLPNELELSENGITAYNNSNDRYARLDYRGLYVNNGAIQVQSRSGRRTIIDGRINRSSSFAKREPNFKSTEVISDGSDWFRTSSRSYVTALTEHYVHDARYMMVVVAINNWGYDDIVDARMETYNGKISNYLSTEELGGGTHYGWLEIDLGEPLDRPSTGTVQIDFRARNGNQVRLHVANRFLTDFPDQR